MSISLLFPIRTFACMCVFKGKGKLLEIIREFINPMDYILNIKNT